MFERISSDVLVLTKVDAKPKGRPLRAAFGLMEHFWSTTISTTPEITNEVNIFLEDPERSEGLTKYSRSLRLLVILWDILNFGRTYFERN